MESKYSTLTSLLTSIIFFIVGALLFRSPDGLIITISQIIGGILFVIGLFNSILYGRKKSNNLPVSTNIIIYGIVLMVIGLLFIFLSGAFATAVRYLMGSLILISGINKLITTLQLGPHAKNYTSLLILSFILIGIGVYIILVANLIISAIGLILMIYSALEIISYIMYKTSGVTNTNTKDDIKAYISNKKDKKRIKDAKIKESDE